MVDGDRVGGRPERRRDGGLVARSHGHQRRDRAEQAADLVGGGQQGAGTVLAGQAQLERLLAGRQPGLASLGGVDVAAEPGRAVSSIAPRADSAASSSASRPDSPALSPAISFSWTVNA